MREPDRPLWEVIEDSEGRALVSTGDSYTADRIEVPDMETARMLVAAHNARIEAGPRQGVRQALLGLEAAVQTSGLTRLKAEVKQQNTVEQGGFKTLWAAEVTMCLPTESSERNETGVTGYGTGYLGTPARSPWGGSDAPTPMQAACDQILSRSAQVASEHDRLASEHDRLAHFAAER